MKKIVLSVFFVGIVLSLSGQCLDSLRFAVFQVDTSGCNDFTLKTQIEFFGAQLPLELEVIYIDGPSQTFDVDTSVLCDPGLRFDQTAWPARFVVQDSLNCDYDTLIRFPVINIMEPNVLSIVVVPDDPSCRNASDGAISTSTLGGVPPYSYLWSNGDTTQNIDSIPAGAYFLTVTDFNGCQTSTFLSLSAPDSARINSFVNDASCNDCNGSVVVSVTGGVAPYTYQFPGDGNGTFLCPGSYTMTVTDANACPSLHSFVIDSIPFQDSITIDTIFTAGQTYDGIPIHRDTTIGRWLTDENGCFYWATINIMLTTVDVVEFDLSNEIQIFPNPAKDIINYNLLFSPNEPVRIDLFNAQGQVLQTHVTTTSFQLITHPLPSGVYWIKTQLGTTSFIKRVVIIP